MIAAGNDPPHDELFRKDRLAFTPVPSWAVRRISLISVGVVGRHKKTKNGGGGLVGGGGGPPVCIPPVPTSLPPALSCVSHWQVSLKILSSTMMSNSVSGQRSTSSNISTADL